MRSQPGIELSANPNSSSTESGATLTVGLRARNVFGSAMKNGSHKQPPTTHEMSGGCRRFHNGPAVPNVSGTRMTAHGFVAMATPMSTAASTARPRRTQSSAAAAEVSTNASSRWPYPPSFAHQNTTTIPPSSVVNVEAWFWVDRSGRWAFSRQRMATRPNTAQTMTHATKPLRGVIASTRANTSETGPVCTSGRSVYTLRPSDPSSDLPADTNTSQSPRPPDTTEQATARAASTT